MSKTLMWGAISVLCVSATTQATITQFPNKLSFLVALRGDICTANGLATPGSSSTALTASLIATNNLNRTLVIDSNLTSPHLISWSFGVGAPNPFSITSLSMTGAPVTALGCMVHVVDVSNHDIGGTVGVSLSNGDTLVSTVPPGGMYISFISSSPFTSVTVNCAGGVMEMLDDICLGDAIGHAASDIAPDAGRAALGDNVFDSSNASSDQFPFTDTFGQNMGNNTHDVWWTFVPIASGTLDANTQGSSFDTLLGIYDGNQVPANNTTPLAFNDDASFFIRSSEVQLHVDANRLYYIRVGGTSDGRRPGYGAGRLSLSLTPETQCPADFNQDGTVDFFDYLDFVDAFSIGC